MLLNKINVVHDLSLFWTNKNNHSYQEIPFHCVLIRWFQYLVLFLVYFSNIKKNSGILKCFRVFIHTLRYLQCNKKHFFFNLFFYKPIYKTHYILKVERAPPWLSSHSIFFSEFGEQPIPQKPELSCQQPSDINNNFCIHILQWLSLLLNLRLDKHEDSKA